MSEVSRSNNPVKRFVRSVLGCSCPDEVFNNIHPIDNMGIFPCAQTIYDIGGRLLVVLFLPGEWREIETRLEQLVETGKKYRDAHGYNRLRFVVATDDNKAAQILQRLFNSLANIDEKIHLHVIETQALPPDEYRRAIQ